MTFRPPLITKIQPRFAVQGQVASFPLELRGQDKFFRGAGHVSVYDWPNPMGFDLRSRAWPAVELRTFINPGGQKLLLGKDKIFADAGQVPDYNWPNPRAPIPAISLKTWTDGNRQILIGKDSIYGSPGQVPEYNWPNPKGLGPAISLLTWDQGNLLSTLLGGVIPPKPFLQLDWPVPKGPVPAIDLKSWLMSAGVRLIGQDTLFGAPGQVQVLDWQNPRAPFRFQPTDIQNLLTTLLVAVAAQSPFAQLDWPVPIGARPNILLKSWLDETKILLVGQDRIFGPPGMVKIYDWPNPRGPQHGIVLKTWIDQLKRNLAGKDTFYTSPGRGPVFDWPNPRGPVPGISLREWYQGNLASTLYTTIPSTVNKRTVGMAPIGPRTTSDLERLKRQFERLGLLGFGRNIKPL